MAWRDLTVDTTPFRVNRQFRLLFVGQASSAIGSRITDVALPLQVYALTRSNLAVAFIGLVTLAPRLGLSLIGGAVADRVERRRLIIGCELIGLLSTTALVANAFLDRPHLWLVYTIAVVLAAAQAVASPANRSAVPLIVQPEHVTAAIALKSLIYSGSWLIGPAIAGGAKAVGGIKLAFALDVLSYVVGLSVFIRMAAIPPIEAHPDEAEESTLRSVATGLKMLRGNQPLIGSFLQDMNAMVFGFPTALLPGLLDERYDNSNLATVLLYAAPFGGAFVASAMSGWAPKVRRHGLAISAFVAGWGLAIVVFGMVRPLWAAVAALVVAGAMDMFSGVFRQAMLIDATPAAMRGRMEGVGMAVWTTGPALGDMEAGTAARLTSTGTAIWSGGALCTIGAVAIHLALPRFRNYVAASPVDQPAVTAT